MNLENKVCEAIEIIAKSTIEKAGFDKTILAKVVSCVDEESGKYKIKYQDSYSYAYSTSLDIKYNEGSYVYVQVPNNNNEYTKTILSAAENSSVDYGYSIDSEDEYDKLGENCLSSKNYPFKLYGCKSEKRIIYNKDKNDNDLLDINLNEINKNILNANAILLAGNFQVNFEEKPQTGNYGIGFIATFEVNGEKQDIDFRFNSTDMIGMPYEYYNFTRQYKIFNLSDIGEYQEIKEIYIFIENFNIKQKSDILSDSDVSIFIKDLELQAINEVSAEELEGYSLKITATQGNTFEGKGSLENKETRNFLAQIKYKGRVQKAETASFYWFRENSRVFSSSEKYCSYGGNGWECLNQKTKDEISNWINGSFLFQISRTLVTAQKVRFKCVAVYKESQFEKVFTVYNLDTSLPQIKIEIQRDSGSTESEKAIFQNGVGYPTLTCSIDNKSYPNYSYKWTVEDSFNNVSNIVNNEEENFKAYSDYQNIVLAIQNLKEDFSLKEDNLYLNNLYKIINEYEKCTINENELLEISEQEDLDLNFTQAYNSIINQIKNFGNRTFVTYSKNFIIDYYSLKEEIFEYINNIETLKNWNDIKDLTGKSEYSNITLLKCFEEVQEQINALKYNKENYTSIKEKIILIQFNALLSRENEIKAQIDSLYPLVLDLDEASSLSTLDYYGNKVYNFKISEVINSCTIKCSVLNDNEDYIGTAIFQITNNKVQSSNSLILNNGNQIFQYNEAGVSPTDDSNEDPLKLNSLSFNFYTKTGENVSFTSIKNNGYIKWKVPIEDTLIESGLEQEKEEIIENGIRYAVYQDINSLTYSLKQVYKETQNNDIILEILYQGEVYLAKTNFTFLKQGEIGTSGTPYTCRIVPNAAVGSSIPQYPIFSYKLKGRVGTFNFYNQKTNEKWVIGTDTTDKTAVVDSFPFVVEIYENNSLTYKGYLGESNAGTAGDISYILDWSFLCNLYKKNVKFDLKDYSTFIINKTDNSQYLTLNQYDDDQDREDFSTLEFKREYGMADILKCQIKRVNKTTKEENSFYATLPIAILISEDEEPNLDLVIKNGFQFVEYNSNGLEPRYKDLYPFELSFLNKENYNYNWSPYGSVWDISSGDVNKFSFIKDYNIGIESVVEDENLVPYKIKGKPNQKYNGLNVTSGLNCRFLDEEKTYYLFIPIHSYLNRYSFSNLNGWDGNSLQVNEEGGFILTPQLAAGKKNQDNSFTGLVMGQILSPDSAEKIGLLGLSNGNQSLFLDAQTGRSSFGLVNNGQLMIDPSKNSVLLYNSKAWKNIDENGFPTSVDYNNYSGEGMIIDLTNSRIKSPYFEIDERGKLIATEASFSGKITATSFVFSADNKNTSSIDRYGFTILDNGYKVGYMGELGIEGRSGQGIQLNASPNGKFSGIGHLDSGKTLSTPAFYWCRSNAFWDNQREGLYTNAPLYLENDIYANDKKGITYTLTLKEGIKLYFNRGLLTKVEL